MTERRALVVEVDAATQLGLLGFLRVRGYLCVAVSSAAEAREALTDGSFSFTLVDLTSNGTDAAELIQCLKVHGRNSGPIIAVADRRNNGRDAASLEVEAVLHKPLNLDELQQAIDKLVRPQAEALGPAPEQVAGRIRREMELWSSPKMLEARQILREAARVDVTVLVTGETGTGKELVARAVHHFSSRRAGPFVKVNCAAMPRELLESELFGYERGAFTGAHKLKIGKFEAAHHGTIFLDEIGEIDPSTQVKLLRVMSEQRAFERVGGTQTLRADVRVIAATNKNLEQMVREGKFRDDLYFRLNVVRITMPPLRARKEDIPLLVRSFLRHFSKVNEKPVLDITTDAMNTLLAYDWPGNVRELRTAIEHGVVMASGPKVTVRDLPRAIREAAGTSGGAITVSETANPLDLAETEKRLITQALNSTGGNITAAATQLGISRRTLHRKLNELNAQGRNVREQARAAKKRTK